jgi:hypothetical protein
MTPIALTDEQMDSVLRAAAPLLPQDRSAFLEEVARELAALPELGDGALHRVIMQVQRCHFDPPATAAMKAHPKHRVWLPIITRNRIGAGVRGAISRASIKRRSSRSISSRSAASWPGNA